jgi:hypothetical protein
LNNESVFERFHDPGFQKTTRSRIIDSSQKAALNRQGNALLNSGQVEEARRIFLATGYSDGLARVGDAYLKAGRSYEALKMYWLAPDRTKAEAVISRLSAIIQKVLQEDEVN